MHEAVGGVTVPKSDVIFQKFDNRYRPIPNLIEIGVPIPDRLSFSTKFPDILPLFEFWPCLRFGRLPNLIPQKLQLMFNCLLPSLILGNQNWLTRQKKCHPRY